jgi:dTDP-4-dehydrorhamnose reductase
MSRILVTGASGQLGQCLKRASKNSPFSWDFIGRLTLDLSQTALLEHRLAELLDTKETATSSPYTYFIHTAAYTQVDAAETAPETAFVINETATVYIAKACAARGICLIYISTDFVFSGVSSRPWRTSDPISPQGVYAKSKAAGEKVVAQFCPMHYVIRTSWLYSDFENNFVKTMLRLGASQPSIKVVEDQLGTPTSALDLARAIVGLISAPGIPFGLHHFSNLGSTHWAGFAREIFKQSGMSTVVRGISSQEFGAAAPRPPFSVLKNSMDPTPRPWQEALTEVLGLIENKE